MDRKRLMTEVMALQKVIPVRYDLKNKTPLVKLEQINYPEGWHPGEGEILYEIPRTYPRRHPTVYIPDRMRYRGSRPEHMSTKSSTRFGSRWSKWCIVNLDWDQERHTLATMTKLMVQSLKKPNGARVLP